MGNDNAGTMKQSLMEQMALAEGWTLEEEGLAAQLIEKIGRGKSISKASQELGIDRMRATRLYRVALEAMAGYRQELGSLTMEDQLQKIEWVMMQLESGVEGGSARAAEVYLKALEQRARLLNLFPQGQMEGARVAIQVNFNGMDTASDDDPVVIRNFGG